MKFKIFINCFTKKEEEIPVIESLENDEGIPTTIYHIKMYIATYLNEDYDNIKITIIRDGRKLKSSNDDIEIEDKDKLCVQKLNNESFKSFPLKSGYTLKELNKNRLDKLYDIFYLDSSSLSEISNRIKIKKLDELLKKLNIEESKKFYKSPYNFEDELSTKDLFKLNGLCFPNYDIESFIDGIKDEFIEFKTIIYQYYPELSNLSDDDLIYNYIYDIYSIRSNLKNKIGDKVIENSENIIREVNNLYKLSDRDSLKFAYKYYTTIYNELGLGNYDILALFDNHIIFISDPFIRDRVYKEFEKEKFIMDKVDENF